MTKKRPLAEIEKCFRKNMGFYVICSISNIPEGTEISKSSLPDNIVFMRYASITSTDAERNFSSYVNNLLADSWQAFLFDNIKKVLLVQ